MSNPVSRVLELLDGVRRSGSGWTAKCPGHDDRHASLSINEGDDGRVLLKCHAGCSVDVVLAALGLELRDLFPAPRSASHPTAPEPARPSAPGARSFDERAIETYQAALLADPRRLVGLERSRGWSGEVVERFGVGLDGDRIVFPYRDASGVLVGLGWYQPDPALRHEGPKLWAAPGSRRELFPPPDKVHGDPLYLVEGESDALAALSVGLAVVGVPGVGCCRGEWRERFAGRRVVVVFDCDGPGREAASRVAADLAGVVEEVRVVDLDPERRDGYDLSDFLADESVADLERLVSEEPAWAPAPRHLVQGDSRDAVLSDVVAFLRQHLAVDEPVYVLLSIWAAGTHAIDCFGTTAYLHVTSTEPSSGKTRVLELLELLVRAPMRGSNLSLAVLYRAIDQRHPTLLLDEIDNLLGDRATRADLIGVLNDGYRRGGRVYRMGGADNSTLLEFRPFCAKVFAGLKPLPTDALRSRCLRIEVKPRKQTEPGAGFIFEDEEPRGHRLRDRLADQFGDVAADVQGKRPPRLDGVSDRIWECVRPLVILAELAGGEWPEKVGEAITSVVKGAAEGALSAGVRLLADCRQVFDQTGKSEIAKLELLDALVALEGAPYAEWERFTTNRLTRTLKKYSIRGDTTVHDEFGKSHRGWRRHDFQDAWERWLPPTRDEDRANRANGVVEPDLAGSEACEQPAAHGSEEPANADGSRGCTLRTLSTPRPGDPDYRSFLNSVHAAGQLTDRERHQRRIAHDLVLRLRPPAGEARILAEVNELIEEGVLIEPDEQP